MWNVIGPRQIFKRVLGCCVFVEIRVLVMCMREMA